MIGVKQEPAADCYTDYECEEDKRTEGQSHPHSMISQSLLS